MTSLRGASRTQFGHAVARVLVAALLAAMLPAPAGAARADAPSEIPATAPVFSPPYLRVVVRAVIVVRSRGEKTPLAVSKGPAGNRTRIVEHQGLPQQRTLDYGYDSLYRLTGEAVTENLGLVYSKTFGYDPVGNRQSQATVIGPAGSPGPSLQPGTIGYGYDARDRLLSEQLDVNPATAYGWDHNGNLTTKDAEATYTWNAENRLTRVQKTDGTVVDYLYDVDGTRVQTNTTKPGQPTETIDYLVDTSGSLSHVVADVDSSAATPTLRALYVRGDDLLSVMRPLGAAPASATDWQTRYYHADGIGSIRRLTDEAGNITDGYTYSAFGELLAHTGSDPQPYAFSGEPLDPNSGFQYHRARWMDPRNGRFTGMDPYAGSVFDPPALHRYLYANSQPTNLVDPTGKMTLTMSLTIGAVIGTIAGIAVGVTIAHFRGLTISEPQFWYWVGGGAVTGAAVGAIATWALIKFGMISVAYAGTTAPAVNWLADNTLRAWHIVRPEHVWERVASLPAPNTFANALTNYRAILPVIEEIVATTAPRTVTLANGAQKLIYVGAHAGQQITVRIFVSPTGQRLIEDAWVVSR